MVDAEISALLRHGARIIPVVSRDKRPVGAGWHERATNDPDAIAGWIERGNIGICLGHGNLIDIEFDDHAAYEGFMEMETASGVPLHEIETPCWNSHRGTHHLFRLEGQLPDRAFAKLPNGVEVRLGGRAAQSVLPPSTHPTGFRYRWLTRPSECAPAPLRLADIGL